MNTNGRMNMGAVNRHACSVVHSGLAPVMAAAANGANAVGGETSDSTAR